MDYEDSEEPFNPQDNQSDLYKLKMEISELKFELDNVKREKKQLENENYNLKQENDKLKGFSMDVDEKYKIKDDDWV